MTTEIPVGACTACEAPLPEHTCCGDHPGAPVRPLITPERFVWTVEIELAPDLVADGADLTESRVHDMLARAFPYTYSHELSARVLSAPDAELIAREQGYPSAAAMRQARGLK